MSTYPVENVVDIVAELLHVCILGKPIAFKPVHVPDRMAFFCKFMPMDMDVGELWHPAT